MLSKQNAELLEKMPVEYKKIFQIFFEICEVPHGSGNRLPITRWLQNFAEAHGLQVITDGESNVLIKVPATAGFEKYPCICLQGHTDMVCVKAPNSNHNFTKDPLQLIQEDGWLKASGTTLGADDGIALAIALALVEKDAPHGPLELLFTSDEEIGLIGASALKKCLDAKYLINLDSEDFGEICVSCAGGFRVFFEKNYKKEAVNAEGFSLKIGNYLGGHSGCEIHLYRANCIKQLCKLLKRFENVRICEIVGGQAHNAIPSSCEVKILVDNFNEQQAQDFFKEITEVFLPQENKATLDITKTLIDQAFSAVDSKHIIDFVLAVPHGPQRISQNVKDFVETSFATTIIKTEGDKIHILGSGRSSHEQELDYLYLQCKAIGDLAGYETSPQQSRYPGWPAKVDSPLVVEMVNVYKQFTEPHVGAIHAGLEAGMISKLHPGMDAISIGPTILSPHSPQERCKIDTVGKIYDIVQAILVKLDK